MRKFILSILIFLFGSLVGYLVFDIQNPGFEKLNSEAIYQRIIEQREYAIEKARESGDYRCCISPACTMCYMEANQWNNHRAGTCACDDFIAKREDPCPQCKKGLVIDTGSSCEITAENCDQAINN